MTNFEKLLKILTNEKVDFIVIGGVAANIHGITYQTYVVDICYSRDKENLERLVNALRPTYPTLRGAPKELPFLFDELTLKAGLNFTFQTTLGDIDILGEVGGVGFYNEVKKNSVEVEVFGMKFFIIDLDALIAAKKFAGRKKDEPVIFELEAIKELLKNRK